MNLAKQIRVTGEIVTYFSRGEDVMIQRADGNLQYYCPMWYWPFTEAGIIAGAERASEGASTISKPT